MELAISLIKNAEQKLNIEVGWLDFGLWTQWPSHRANYRKWVEEEAQEKEKQSPSE